MVAYDLTLTVSCSMWPNIDLSMIGRQWPINNDHTLGKSCLAWKCDIWRNQIKKIPAWTVKGDFRCGKKGLNLYLTLLHQSGQSELFYHNFSVKKKSLIFHLMLCLRRVFTWNVVPYFLQKNTNTKIKVCCMLQFSLAP